MKENYPHSDYVWIATDAGGIVGAFATGGEGPIPASVLQATCVPIAQIEKQLLKLPVRCEASMQRRYLKPDSFLALGYRGLFVFDWSDVHRVSVDEIGAYERVCIPSRPLLKSELTPELQQNLSVSVDFAVVFGTITTVDPRTQTTCLGPNT